MFRLLKIDVVREGMVRDNYTDLHEAGLQE
jgi:hypothetical protein